jgi:hypothetical protein
MLHEDRSVHVTLMVFDVLGSKPATGAAPGLLAFV